MGASAGPCCRSPFKHRGHYDTRRGCCGNPCVRAFASTFPAGAQTCPRGWKIAAGACVQSCPGGYEDRGRTCEFRRGGGGGTNLFAMLGSRRDWTFCRLGADASLSSCAAAHIGRKVTRALFGGSEGKPI